MKTMLRGVVLLAALGAAPSVFAGEEEDRVREVEDSLNRMKDRLDGISSKSSSSDIEEAIRMAYKVKENADKLRSLGAQNDPGKTMADRYADWVDKFQESARALKEMKEAQLKADNDRLTERCTEADRNLTSLMLGFVDKKDKAEGRKGLITIPDEAEKIGRAYGEELKKMEEKHREMERWKGSARYFSESHQKWSDVRSELNDGANEIWDRWNRRMEESRYKCQEIAKGKDNSRVQDALAKLGSHNKGMQDSYKELRRNFYAWRADLNSFRATALQDAKEIHEAYCNKLDWERQVNAIADRYASELNGKWSRLQSDRDKMLSSADLLISMGSENAPKLKRWIVQAWDRVEPVKDGELRGANNPMVRARLLEGKRQHDARQSGCNMKETGIDSSWCKNPHPDRSDCRLDCVKSCTIIEIKPNNAGEIEMGAKQVTAYKEAFEKMWRQEGEKMFTMDSGRYAHLQRCVSNPGTPSASLRLETFVETYAFCQGEPNVYFGTRDPIPTDDVPENAND